MSSVQFEEGAVSVDAVLIAEGLSLEPAQVQPLMRQGQITSLCERGLDEDVGRYRLTFFHHERRFSLLVNADGKVIQRSVATTGGRRRRSVRRGGSPSRENHGKPK